MANFKANSTYYTRCVGDSDIKVCFKVIKRSEKMLTLESGKRCKIFLDTEGGEFIYPDGRHSMCLVIRAAREVIDRSIKDFALSYGIDPTETAVREFFDFMGKSSRPHRDLLISTSTDQVIYRDFI